MGQAESTPEDPSGHEFSADDWGDQVLSEYTKLHDEVSLESVGAASGKDNSKQEVFWDVAPEPMGEPYVAGGSTPAAYAGVYGASARSGIGVLSGPPSAAAMRASAALAARAYENHGRCGASGAPAASANGGAAPNPPAGAAGGEAAAGVSASATAMALKIFDVAVECAATNTTEAAVSEADTAPVPAVANNLGDVSAALQMAGGSKRKREADEGSDAEADGEDGEEGEEEEYDGGSPHTTDATPPGSASPPSAHPGQLSKLGSSMEAALSALYDEAGLTASPGLPSPGLHPFPSPRRAARAHDAPMMLWAEPGYQTSGTIDTEDYLSGNGLPDYSASGANDPIWTTSGASAADPGMALSSSRPQSWPGGGGGGEERDSRGRAIWSKEEDELIWEAVKKHGPKWRKISQMMKSRSDDAVRNRYQRLAEQDRTKGRKAAAADAGGADVADRPAAAPSPVPGTPTQPNDNGKERDRTGSGSGAGYKCSRCGQPKKGHVCTAPGAMSNAEATRQRRQVDERAGEARSVWSRAEDEIILNFVRDHGPKWVDIAQLLTGRTEHAARNRFHRLTARCGDNMLNDNALNSLGIHPPSTSAIRGVYGDGT